MPEDRPGWSESASEQFLAFADVITPSRDEQAELLLDLIPAGPADRFQVVELACGGGDLAARLLTRFREAAYLGMDGSQTMLNASGERLKRFAGRVRLEAFDLEDFAKHGCGLGQPPRCIVSSLAIHHLDDAGKQRLFRQAFDLLAPGGALLIIDIVQPRSGRGVAALARNWDAVALAQSKALTGSTADYEKFKNEGWNCYSDPDPLDMPAPLLSQLEWLEAAGFRDVDCFWQRCGHALFGGYKLCAEERFARKVFS